MRRHHANRRVYRAREQSRRDWLTRSHYARLRARVSHVPQQVHHG